MKIKIKEFVRHKFYDLLSIVNALVPKKRQIFLYADQYLYDSLESMANFCIANSDIKVILPTNNCNANVLSASNVRIVKNNILSIIKNMMQSKYILDISLHSIKMKPAHNQKNVQIWHGSPLKKLESEERNRNEKYYSSILVSSQLFMEPLIHFWKCTNNKLVIMGFPRNDDLFYPANVKADEKTKIMWLPTFRHGIGREETKKDIPLLDENNIKEFNTFLKNNGIRLFVKFHPLQQAGNTHNFFENQSNISILTDSLLRKENCSLYNFMGSMDALLTDYSSAYFDYLLLDRPIGFIVSDMDEYSDNRGFSFENPLEYMPGEHIYTLEQLRVFFSSVVNGEDHYSDKRHVINQKVNFYSDAGNCKRLYAFLTDQMDG